MIPISLGLVLNSYSAPDAADDVRMAFAQVAGATISIVTVLGLLLHRIVRRSPLADVLWFAFIAIIVVSSSVAGFARASDFLMTGLGIPA